MPLDSEDTLMVGRLLIFSLLILWVAVLLGIAVRAFLWLSFGGW